MAKQFAHRRRRRLWPAAHSRSRRVHKPASYKAEAFDTPGIRVNVQNTVYA